MLALLRWRHARCAPWGLNQHLSGIHPRRPTLSQPTAPTNLFATTSPTTSSTQSAAASSSSTKAIIGNVIYSVVDIALGVVPMYLFAYLFAYRPSKRKQGEVSAGGKLPLQSADVPPAEPCRQEDGRRIHKAGPGALARGSR